jgi:isopropylmalate/homocitrate/citramalate synthase
MIIFVSATESHNRSNVNQTIDESLAGFEIVTKIARENDIPVRGSVAVAFDCPFAPTVSGNVCKEDLIQLIHKLGVGTGIDLDALIKVAKRMEEVIGRPLPGQVTKAEKRLSIHLVTDQWHLGSAAND